MGFWGTFVVHRGDRALGELLPHVAEFGEAELCAGGAPGGWQVTRVFCSLNELTEGFLTGLRDLTAAPVLAADVLDSDAAFVTALGVHTEPWDKFISVAQGRIFTGSSDVGSPTVLATHRPSSARKALPDQRSLAGGSRSAMSA